MELLLYDISKQKKAEHLIKEELEKLKELDEIRKNLIIRVSHELKTPLVSVCGGTELLLDKFDGELGKEAKEIIHLIGNGGNRLKILVRSLLDVSRLEENKLILEKSKTNLTEIIEESVKEMTYAIRKRNLILDLKIPQFLYLKMDPMRIQQVINNLLSNAIKNTPPKGKISIVLTKDKDYVILTVEDTGVGFTKKEKEMLFTRFGKIERHGHGLEDTDIQGSGIGLFISRELVKLHGGVIQVESPGRNKGSTFTVKLPIK
jgi:signal transduction histidine kinase